MIDQTALRNVKVLVVDDSVDMQILTKTILTKAGAQVSICPDGLQLLKGASQYEDVDVVLMDSQMPFMNGTEVTQRLRARGFSKPIVALTANATHEEKQISIESGCNDYRSKPISPNDLIDVIQKWATPADNTAASH